MSSDNVQASIKQSILAQACRVDANRYLDRHAYTHVPDLPAVDPNLGLIVVIPAMAEPDILFPLESVAQSTRPDCKVEIIVVINAPDDADAQMRQMTADSLDCATEWAASVKEPGFDCHVLDYSDLPARHASVGLARKLGMDVALTRLATSYSGWGAIACLDADCRVDPNYLQAIGQAFECNSGIIGATVYFEHPVDETAPALQAGIIDYETHLRCYKQGLQVAGSGYARHTVGSAFTVRSDIYAQEGGMNRRSAGEDFYFINKLIKRGPVGEINTTTVYPSARLSRRVPFGTGAAMWQRQDSEQLSYAPSSYLRLRDFRAALRDYALHGKAMPVDFDPFVKRSALSAWMTKMQVNVASDAAMMGQLDRWLDGFREMKFLNWHSEVQKPKVEVQVAAREILEWLDQPGDGDALTLLERLRYLDRSA